MIVDTLMKKSAFVRHISLHKVVSSSPSKSVENENEMMNKKNGEIPQFRSSSFEPL